jgi:hypothetical protein
MQRALWTPTCCVVAAAAAVAQANPAANPSVTDNCIEFVTLVRSTKPVHTMATNKNSTKKKCLTTADSPRHQTGQLPQIKHLCVDMGSSSGEERQSLI